MPGKTPAGPIAFTNLPATGQIGAVMVLSLQAATELVKKPQGMTGEEARALVTLLLEQTLTADEGGALLRAWTERGETGVELSAVVTLLKEHAVTVPVTRASLDLVGTGGSGLVRYNISTTAAFVVASAELPVAKHGNRGSLRPNGSFDLLDELGIPFELSPETIAALHSETGLCFLYARTHHPLVGKMVAYRKTAGRRSIFNLAGPLANPVRVKHQLIGAATAHTAQVLAEALQLLNTDGALVVWGEPGIDEVSITGTTGYLHVKGETIDSGVLQPKANNLSYDFLPGGDAKENAQTFFRLLSGAENGPLLDMLVENAGVAIDLWNGLVPSIGGPGAEQARALISSGAAIKKFEQHRDAAIRLAL